MGSQAKKKEKEQPLYYAVKYLLGWIDKPNRKACRCILRDYRKLFKKAQGSGHNHQAWPGGYLDHVAEVMNIAVILYRLFSSLRPLPFSLSDLLLVLFLHDLEKPWKYCVDRNGNLQYKPKMQAKAQQHAFREKKFKKYGIVLTPELENGLKYVEGEFNDYSKERRVMGELAALAHMCDVASARLWHAYPAKKRDPWRGAKRVGSK